MKAISKKVMMSKMKIELTNETLISYVRTEDAIEAFENTAEAGQTRLSLQVLVEVINGLVSKVDELEENIKNLTPIKEEKILEVEAKTAPKAKEPSIEKVETVEEEKESKVKV